MIQSKKNRDGFMLLEIGIALALLLVLVTLSIPHMSFLHRHVVRSEIEKLYAFCVYLQHKAIASNRDQMIQFDDAGYSYNGVKTVLSSAVQFGVLPGTQGPPSCPTHSITKPNTFKNNCIIFYSDGKMQPGSLYIIDKAYKYMYALTVPVGEISYLRKYVFENQWALLS